MFYNYLIFSMVALSLRIFKKYFVSTVETYCSSLANTLFRYAELFVFMP